MLKIILASFCFFGSPEDPGPPYGPNTFGMPSEPSVLTVHCKLIAETTADVVLTCLISSDYSFLENGLGLGG